MRSIADKTVLDSDALCAAVAELHNLGEIDALTVLLGLSSGTIWPADYLERAQLLGGIVLRLDADAARMMQATLAHVRGLRSSHPHARGHRDHRRTAAITRRSATKPTSAPSPSDDLHPDTRPRS